jgi:hypothetical protein
VDYKREYRRGGRDWKVVIGRRWMARREGRMWVRGREGGTVQLEDV